MVANRLDLMERNGYILRVLRAPDGYRKVLYRDENRSDEVSAQIRLKNLVWAIFFSFREKEKMSLTEKTDIRDSDEKVVEIEMERLRTFTNHPFKVIDDSQMIELQDSIKKYGVLNPLIVRPRKEGYYEIISGHRRKYAAERLGYKKIPVIIRMMQDDEAVVTMVDSNLQREQITASEKAYAYKMKYDAIKKKAGRKNRYVLYCAKRYVQI